jgi:poly-gamma-glutamate system protein
MKETSKAGIAKAKAAKASKAKLSAAWFPVMLAVLVMGAAIALDSLATVRRPSPYHAEMAKAGETMARAERAIAARRVMMGIPVDPSLDPNRTGLIGIEMSPLTTTVGDLESKRTSTNPDFAALVVLYYHEIGLKKGDRIAIGSSGSFPGILIAVLSACDAMGVVPELIASVGSSEYGANIPGLSTVEMLSRLEKEGILPFSPIAISPGGAEDKGTSQFSSLADILNGMSFDIGGYTRALTGVPIIEEKDIATDIRRRISLYEKAGPVKAFINIGGADVNYGSTTESLKLPNGLVRDFVVRSKQPDRGLVFEFLEKGLPVINFIDIRGLARKSGIPIDPVPFPEIGTSDLYLTPVSPQWLSVLGLVAAIAILTLGRSR